MADRPTTDEHQPRPRRRLVVWARRIGWLAVVVVGVLAVAPRLGTSVSGVGPGRVSIGFEPALHGQTTLALPPVGEASARTHAGPVQVRLELRSLDVPSLLSDGGRVDTVRLEAAIRDDVQSAVVAAAGRFLIAGLLVGCVAAAVLPGRRLGSVALGGLVGGLTAAILAASALPGFDVSKFDDLTYQGPVNAGTQLLKTLTSDTGVVGERVDALSNKLAGLYSASLTDSLDDEDEVVILHISDLHLNPIGAQLARSLAVSFGVDAVVDTGDTTSFGTQFEGPYGQLLADFPVPYLFVAGNHDSIPNREAIKATPGITALHRTAVDVEGVTIVGFDDPIITTVEDVPIDQREAREAESAPALRRLIERERPDVVAVHNPVILKSIVGTVPLAIAGHQHHYKLGARKRTIVAIAGSTGATGLGSLLAEADLPAEANLLRFRDGKLVAIDRLEIIGTNGDLTVQRHTITAADRDGDTAGFIFHDVDEATEPATVEDDDGDEDTTTTSSPDEPTTSLDPASAATTTTTP